MTGDNLGKWMDSGHGSIRTVVANGLRQNVLVVGEAVGRTVLLIHGLGWDHSVWRFQVDPVVARGWRVVAPDLRGMGATDKPAGQWSIDDYVADLVALLDRLDITRVVLAGFSLGGTIAAAFAIAHPDRAAGLFMAAASVSSSAEGRAGTEAMLKRASTLGPTAFAEEQARAIWHPGWAAAHPREVAEFIAWRAAMDQPALHRAFRSSYGVDLRDGLKGLRIPARIVAADADPFVAVDTLRRTAELILGADLVVIPDAGHMVPIERPEAFTTALTGFLDRL
jgi:pimeloyl-ACP methyl ester carboxylesterase